MAGFNPSKERERLIGTAFTHDIFRIRKLPQNEEWEWRAGGELDPEAVPEFEGNDPRASVALCLNVPVGTNNYTRYAEVRALDVEARRLLAEVGEWPAIRHMLEQMPLGTLTRYIEQQTAGMRLLSNNTLPDDIEVRTLTTAPRIYFSKTPTSGLLTWIYYEGTWLAIEDLAAELHRHILLIANNMQANYSPEEPQLLTTATGEAKHHRFPAQTVPVKAVPTQLHDALIRIHRKMAAAGIAE